MLEFNNNKCDNLIIYDNGQCFQKNKVLNIMHTY